MPSINGPLSTGGAAPLDASHEADPVEAAPASAPASGAPSAPAGLPTREQLMAKLAATAAGKLEGAEAGPSYFDLVPGRYPDAVSLSQVLSHLQGTPEGDAAVRAVIDRFQQATGVTLPPAVVQAALANPGKLADLLALSPKELSAGVDAMETAQRTGAHRIPVPPPPAALPDGFDLANMAGAPVTRPESDLKEIAPGLLQGDLKSDLPDDRAQANIVTAEVFSRLAANSEKPAGEQFHVSYGGAKYDRLDSFLDALAKDGYSVTAEVNHRVANFADLKTKTPDGEIVDVPAALNVKTGVIGKDGKEAVLPTMHSELLIHVRSGPGTKGPKIDSDVKFYQGISGTGFFPSDVMKTPAWTGSVVTDRFSGKQALDAVKLSGALGNVINAAAKDNDLAMGGYGATGVCNDSVAVVQYALKGRTTAYPLVMRDALLFGEIDKKLGHEDKRDDALLKTLRASIAQVPSDAQPNATARTRALASIPWKPGAEPFAAVADARKALSGK